MILGVTYFDERAHLLGGEHVLRIVLLVVETITKRNETQICVYEFSVFSCCDAH